MPQCIVIADDLTGANATGVLLKQMNYKAATILNRDSLNKDSLNDYDCVIYPTDSRGVNAEEAYQRVFSASACLKSPEVKLYSKRIDSTLRGNLGSETDAILDCLGDEYIAIVVPCFPSSGRIVIGGYMLVNGLQLHKTDVSIDPKTPVKDSNVARLLSRQSKYQISSIYLNSQMNGKHALARTINNHVAAGSRIIIFDAVTSEDLELIADAVITSGIKAVTVDPGAFTATLARKLITPYAKSDRLKILAVVGSVNPITKMQIDALLLSQRTNSVMVDTRKLIENEQSRADEIARVVKAVSEKADLFAVSAVIGDGINPEARINFKEYQEKLNCSVDDITHLINSAFGEITASLLSKIPAFKGLYTSGGDITIAVCKKMQTSGIELLDEVLPLAAYGQFKDGPFKGISIITKGGSQGKKDAVIQCIDYLKQKLFI